MIMEHLKKILNMNFKLFCFSGFIFLHICSAFGEPASIQICNGKDSSAQVYLYHNNTGPNFCYCSVHSSQSFTLSVKRIMMSNSQSDRDTETHIFINGTNSNEENATQSHKMIDLMEVYNDPLGPDCLVINSPNVTSPESCWINLTTMIEFGIYENISSYMNIYLTLQGKGIINTTCTNSTSRPEYFTVAAAERNNKSSESHESVTTGISNNSAIMTNTVNNKQNEDENFPNAILIGLLLICIGAVFLLIAVLLCIITARKKGCSKKKHTSTKDDPTALKNNDMISTLDDTVVQYEEINKEDQVLSKTFNSPADSKTCTADIKPTEKIDTEGYTDLEMQGLEKKPHYTTTDNLHNKDITDLDNSSPVKSTSDKNKTEFKIENEKEQNVKDKSPKLTNSDTSNKNLGLSMLVSDANTVQHSKHSVKISKQKTAEEVCDDKETREKSLSDDSENENINLKKKDLSINKLKDADVPRNLEKELNPDSEDYYQNYNTDKRDTETTQLKEIQSLEDDQELYVNCSQNASSNESDPDKATIQNSSESNKFSNINKSKENLTKNETEMMVTESNKTNFSKENDIASQPQNNEPDYDTISSCGYEDETECGNETGDKSENMEYKSLNSKGEEKITPQLSRKESVKIIFLRNPNSTKENLSLQHDSKADEKKSPKPRLKQTKSVMMNLPGETRNKPEVPKRSLSEDTILKLADDSNVETECEHLYDEVDDLKPLTRSDTPSTERNTLSENKKSSTILKEQKMINSQNNDTVGLNKDQMIDNDIYSMLDEDIKGQRDDEQTHIIRNTDVMDQKLDSNIQNNTTSEDIPASKVNKDWNEHEMSKDGSAADYMVDNDLYFMTSSL